MTLCNESIYKGNLSRLLKIINILKVIFIVFMFATLLPGCSKEYFLNRTYNNAVKEFNNAVPISNNDKLDKANKLFQKLPKDYKDTDKYINEINYIQAKIALNKFDDEKALDLFHKLPEQYKDSDKYINEIIYHNAISSFEKESKNFTENNNLNNNFDNTLRLFQSLPEHYNDSDLYINMISAIKYFNANEWLEATQMFESVNNEVKETWSNSSIKSVAEVLLKDRLLLPVYNAFDIGIRDKPDKIFKFVNANNLNDIKIYDEKTGNKFLQNIFKECCYRYYEEQSNKGIDISKLQKYPYKPEKKISDVPPETGKLYDNRIQKLEASIKEKGLTDYYSKADRSISPVKVTGKGIYINVEDDMGKDEIKYKIPPCYIADSPESVRYVYCHYTTSSYYGRYTDGTSGYTRYYHFVLKNAASGQILFEKSFSFNPPYSTSQRGDVYGSWSKTDDFLTSLNRDILPAIKRVVPLYNVQSSLPAANNAVPAPTTPAKTEVPADGFNLLGTIWTETDFGAVDLTPEDFRFSENGILVSLKSGKRNNTWKQNGQSITISINDNYATFLLQFINSDLMKGTASNVVGKNWTVEFRKK